MPSCWDVIGVSDSAAAGVPGSSGSARRRGKAAGAATAEWSFPADPGAVRTARTAVRRVMDDWGLNGAADMAVLLVSELVTNSLRHASGPIGVRMVLLSSDGLLVEVSDPLPDPPLERDAAPDDEGGGDCSWSHAVRGAGGRGAERAVRQCGSSCRWLVRRQMKS